MTVGTEKKLGKRLGVTQADIKKVRAREMALTNQAMMALQAGRAQEAKKILAKRDTQSAWLRTYSW